MRCRIITQSGYYAKRKGSPAWVQSRRDAKVFSTVKLAQGVVRILAQNRIKARIERETGT